jgi:peptidoglycan/LPS O-acetylase OafA/YrhL
MGRGELDGLRGLAALSVMIFHFFCCAPPGWGSAVSWIPRGTPAVDLFFVLSAFVLARSLIYEPQTYGSFVWRRILRLYPAYWVTLVFAILLMSTANRQGMGSITDHYGPGEAWLRPTLKIDQLLKHVFLITPAIDFQRINTVIWSLIIEMRVSLILPFLVAGFVKLPPRFRFFVLLASPLLGLKEVEWSLAGISSVPLFLLGIALAVYVEPRQRPFWITAPLLITGWLLNGVHFSAAAMPAAPQYAAAIGAAMMIASVMSSPLAQRVMTTPPIRFLGDVCYSLYLVHLPLTFFIISWVYPATESPLLCAIMIWSASLLVAAVFRQWIELPGMRLRWGQAAQRPMRSNWSALPS